MKTITVTLTEAEARAVHRALGCPLSGDEMDARAVFLDAPGVAAAVRAQKKLGVAEPAANDAAVSAAEEKQTRAVLLELQGLLCEAAERLPRRAAHHAALCGAGGLSNSERGYLTRVRNALDKARKIV
jgi:hypothetical protein